MFLSEGISNFGKEELNIEPITEGFTGNDVADTLAFINESNEEYFNLCMAMARCEHVAIVREDTALLNEGWESFKTAIKGKWASFVAWIKGLITKVIGWFKTFWRSNDSLLKKYESAFTSNKGKVKVEVEGYSYKDLDEKANNVKTTVDSISQNWSKYSSEDSKEIRKKIEGEFLGSAGSSSANFSTNFMEVVRGRDKKPITVDDTILSTIKNSKAVEHKLNSIRSSIEKLFSTAMSTMAQLGKTEEQEKEAKKAIQVFNVAFSTASTALSVIVAAQKANVVQARSIFIKVATGAKVEGEGKKAEEKRPADTEQDFHLRDSFNFDTSNGILESFMI